jgi:hypothetical protein
MIPYYIRTHNLLRSQSILGLFPIFSFIRGHMWLLSTLIFSEFLATVFIDKKASMTWECEQMVRFLIANRWVTTTGAQVYILVD